MSKNNFLITGIYHDAFKAEIISADDAWGALIKAENKSYKEIAVFDVEGVKPLAKSRF